MTKRTWWVRKHWHPSERDLLLYVNGEGGAKLAPSVRDHLEGCWSCSMKHDRMAGAIAAFMRGRETGLDGEELCEAADRSFGSRLRRLAEKAESERLASRRKSPSRSLRGLPLPAVLAVSLFAAITALVWLRFSSVPSVSAREVLNRSEHAEATRMGAVNGPVVHQLLHVTRRASGRAPESTYLETWRDTKNNRWKQETKDAVAAAGVFTSNDPRSRIRSRKHPGAGDHPVVAELQEVLKSNNMHQNPMSVSSFTGWRSKLKDPVESISETLLENGDKAFRIATSATEPLPKNAITKAEFVVRRKDWHPVEQRLSVSEPDGFRSYEIRETSFEVVALGSLGASIFEQPVLPAPVEVQTSSLDRPLAAESQVDGLELEMALFHRLHQAGACLGEEVRVVRGASAKPEVRGVVESLERKQELTILFAEFPNVPVVIQAAGGEEKAVLAANSGTSEAQPALAAGSNGTQGDSGSSPMKDHLLAYFARLDLPAESQRTRMVEFSNQVISLSQSAHLHGLALRRLAERFNDDPLEKLSPQAVARFRSMANDHLRALSSVVGRCDEMLRPVLASLANPENAENLRAEFAATEAGNWQSRSMRVFESVMKADRLIHSLFAGTEAANLHESSSALLVSLPRVLEDARAAESKLSGLVSVSGPPVISAQSIQQRAP